MASRQAKDALFEAIALMGKAFSSPRRLELPDRLAEVERAAADYLGEEVQRIGRSELLARLADGEVVLIDVRPAEEYAAGHIEGARSIPIEELEQRLAELPDDAEIVAYCRGPFCVYAHEAGRVLRGAGRAARRLEDGWPEWKLST